MPAAQAKLPTLPAAPADLDATSPLGALYRDWQRREAQRDDLAMFPRRVQLKRQLAGYEATLAGASPESDMVQIAAAECGVVIVRRALEPIEREIRDWEDVTERFRERWEAAWRKYTQAVNSMQFYADRSDWVALNEAEATISELLGWPPQ
jgi:hypothetical protein